MNSQLKDIREEKKKAHNVLSLLNETSQLLLDLSFKTEAVKLWQAHNPAFKREIDNYISNYIEEDLHQNNELQENLSKFFSKEIGEGELEHFFRRNPNILNFLSEALPGLKEAGSSWPQAKKNYEDYLSDQFRLQSLQAQITEKIAQDDQFDFQEALRTAEQRITDFNFDSNQTPKQLLNQAQSERQYLEKLNEYIDVKFNIAKFEERYHVFNGDWSAENSNYANVKPRLSHAIDQLKELESQIKPQADAQHFVEHLEKYIQAHSWQVGYQFKDRNLPGELGKKLPTHVALQFNLIQKAKAKEISYEVAASEIKNIGAAAAMENESIKNRFFAARDVGTKEYYKLFLPSKEDNLLQEIGLKPIIQGLTEEGVKKFYNQPN